MSLKELSLNNVKMEYPLTTQQENNPVIRVYNEDNEILAKADCKKATLQNFSANWFYNMLLEPEMNYFFLEVFSEEERELTNNLPLDEYVQYINDNYGYESSILNDLYAKYLKVETLLYNNSSIKSDECIYIEYIESIKNSGAGTLIVDYLKENCNLIFLYSTDEALDYWIDKVNFKEVSNNYMYWTNNKKLNDILQ